MTPREVLSVPMLGNDADALTVGGYLQALLTKLWEKTESFSGKHPFGNSGWERDLCRSLIASGAATGRLDCDGYVVDKGDARQVMFDAIDALFAEPQAKHEGRRIVAAALRAEAAKFDDEAEVAP